MKIGMKRLALWAASMALFIATGLATWLGMEVLDGVSGLAIRFFLCYCAIIIVSQVFSAITAISQLFRDLDEKQSQSIKALLR